MTMEIPGSGLDALLAQAEAAVKRSYAPYSGLPCGAVLVAADGRCFTGASVEIGNSASTVCAPKVALLQAVMAGVREFSLVVVAGAGADMSYLCGDCRESYAEFGSSTEIVSAAHPAVSKSLGNLLPMAFGSRRE